ncbi:MAG: RecQ family ATP-dependent DNA helicase [Bacteroidales bacterium]|nr:RecQ family ATP-dependent DNA helicase [Bacteroidales bacterium]
MLATLKRYWGYDNFRELQAEIIQSVLDGHDTLGLLPTGGGKSITFQVPAMMLPGLTLIVTPLISLMKDQVDNLRQRGIRAYCLHSGMSRAEARLAMDRCRLGKTKMLYVSPERLQSESFIERLREWDVSLIVVDEAHCISQWGYDFRPSYLKIQGLRRIFPDVPVLALTASATPEVRDDIMLQLGFRPGWQSYAKSFDRPNLSYIVRADDYKERTLLRVMQGTTGSAIVYVRSRRRCRELAELLLREGISAQYYHAGLDPQDKEERQEQWKTGAVRVMVATNAFGMGIDKADVRTVVHFDLPSSLEEYYQEAGRAGRDGLPSYAVAIVAKADKATLTRRLTEAFPPKDYIARVYELAGNFLEVAVGSGYDHIYEFAFGEFCHRFDLKPAVAHAALKILTQAGYVEFVDEVQSRTRVMIILPKADFYSLRLDDKTDRVFSALQRAYTGLFADFTPIEESQLARRAEVREEDVYQALLELARQKVILFIPKKKTPYLYYTTSREEPRYLLLPRAVYEDRRDRMAARIEAVKRFAFDADRCRVQTLLGYFGEKDVAECGTCDVCRMRKVSYKQEAKDVEFAKTRLRQALAAEASVRLSEFAARLGIKREMVIEAVRDLADAGKVSVRACGADAVVTCR